MASGDTLVAFTPHSNIVPAWVWVAFNSGDTEPSLGDVIWGDTSNENGVLEYLVLLSGTWGGADAAGWMLLAKVTDTFTTGENWTANTTVAGNDGTFVGTPTVCFATFDTRNHHPVYDFDDGANEIMMFQGYMPQNYDGGGLTVTVSVMCQSATTGDMSWQGFFKSVTPGADDLDDKNFAAPQVNAAVDAPTTLGWTVDFELTFTDGAQMDSVAAGEWFYFLLMRDAQDSTADDMAGDANFIGAEIKET